MVQNFPLLACLVLFSLALITGASPPSYSYNTDDGFGEDNSADVDVQQQKQQFIRSKRGGYIEPPNYGISSAAGGIKLRGPVTAAVYGVGRGYSSGKGGNKPASYGTGTGGGSIPGPMSLYSYAPRRANAAIYGGIWGPQTNEEALKFDTHMTRSMIADAMASSGRRLYSGHGGVVTAAIQSRRNVQFYDVPSTREAPEPITIEVGASPSSQLNIKFKSASSPLAVEQDHESAPGSVRETSSEDEPHRLIHTVTRPIYQEVHEVIKPFRKVTQEIQPVQEDIQTIVARGDEIQGAGIAGAVLTGDDSSEDAGQTIISGSTTNSIPSSGVSYGSGGQGVKPSYESGPVYSSGYSKPKSYGAALGAGPRMTYGASPSKPMYSGGAINKQLAHGEKQMPFAQVQIPYARRAARGARA